MLIEFTMGLIPVLGDAFDAVFNANTRNTRLLRRYHYNELGDEPEQEFPWIAFYVGKSVVFLTRMADVLLMDLKS